MIYLVIIVICMRVFILDHPHRKLIENSDVHCKILEVLLLKTAPPAPVRPSHPRRSIPTPPAPAIPPRTPGIRPVSAMYPPTVREETDRPKSGRERARPPVPTPEESQESDIYMGEERS